MSGLGAGAVLDGKYRLIAQLGSGGMGTVWRADHLALRSPVAVKLMHGRVAGDPAAAARFSREAQAAAALRSPHVVSVLDFGIHETTPYVVMELLEGESLDRRLQRVGRLGVAETARVVTHVARALAKAHEQGVIHRDLKPANVFLILNTDEEIAKVLDFGVAKTSSALEVSPLTATGAVLGTPHYMSPEQARGLRDVDHRSDLWALGIIAFECVTGRRPFESAVLGDLLLKICSDPLPLPSELAAVPLGFDAWFQRATARDPAQRFRSALELAEALRALVPPATAAPVPPIAASAAPAALPQPRSAAPLIAALLLAGLGALGLVAAAGAYAYDAYTAAPPENAAPSSSPAPTTAEPSASVTASARSTPGAEPKASAARAAAKPARSAPAAKSPPPAGTTSSPCVQACNKLRACVPGTGCEAKPCSGVRRALADCINRTPCNRLEDCLP